MSVFHPIYFCIGKRNNNNQGQGVGGGARVYRRRATVRTVPQKRNDDLLLLMMMTWSCCLRLLLESATLIHTRVLSIQGMSLDWDGYVSASSPTCIPNVILQLTTIASHRLSRCR